MRQAFALCLVVCATLMNGTAAAPLATVPVLIELFTAEGCSSCPPADVLLEKMIEAQPAGGAEIVGLGQHVDYWDHTGWRDRFSSAAMTERQRLYAARLRVPSIYTPEMVVDGRTEFVGTDIAAAQRAIERAIAAPHGVVGITLDTPGVNKIGVSVTVSGLPAISAGDRADIIVAVTEDRLRTEVKRGENLGRTLSHAAVVREMRTIGEATGGGATARTAIKIASEWRQENLKVVAFVQERTSRHVLATAAVLLDRSR